MVDKPKKIAVTMEEKHRAINGLQSGVTTKIVASALRVFKSTAGD